MQKSKSVLTSRLRINTHNIELLALVIALFFSAMLFLPLTVLAHAANTTAAMIYIKDQPAILSVDAMLEAMLPHTMSLTPTIRITKLTNGVIVTQPTGLLLPIGDAVAWTYLVTNTGSVTVTDLTITDDVEGTIIISTPPCSQSSRTLAPSRGISCTIDDGIVKAGQYQNVVTATARSTAFTQTVVVTDVSYYSGVAAAISVAKMTNGLITLQPHDLYLRTNAPVTWTYRISNTGSVALKGISIVDNRQGVVTSCSPPLVGNLSPGAGTLCTMTGTVQAGQYANTVTVTGTTATGQKQEAIASAASYYFGLNPAITLVKFTNGRDVSSAPGPYLWAGETVTWTYRITNTGNVTLTGLSLTDNRQGGVTSCVPALATGLAPGAGTICTKTGVVQAGQYANIATVTGTTNLVQSSLTVSMSDSSYYFGVSPAIVLTKYTNGQRTGTPPGVYLRAGDPVTWTYRITNTGNITLTGMALTDNPQGAVTSCIPALTNGLGPRASALCTKTGTVQPGQYSNTATVTGTTTVVQPPLTVSMSDSSYYFGVTPDITLTKYTNGAVANQAPGSLLRVGDTVTWTYNITNTGNVALSVIALTDNREGEIATCAPALGSSLSPGANMSCVKSNLVQRGEYSNTATVTGSVAAEPVSVAVIARDTSYYRGLKAALAVTKLTNGVQFTAAPGALLKPGDPITWTYLITNTGNVQLIELSIQDSQEGAITSCTPSIAQGLAPGAATECIKQGTSGIGQYTNNVTVNGRAATGPEQRAEATAISYYYGSNSTIVKSAFPTTVRVNSEVTFTLVITGRVSDRPIALHVLDQAPPALRLIADSASPTGVTLDLERNQVRYMYATTVNSANPVTITYRARLTTSCIATATNRAVLYEGSTETPVAEAGAVITLAPGEICNVYMPTIQRPPDPPDPMPMLVNGFWDDGDPVGNGWTQLVIDQPGQLLYTNGRPFAALTPPRYAWLGGARNQTNKLRQTLSGTLPRDYDAYLQFCYRLESTEPTCSEGNDKDWVEIRVGTNPTPGADNSQRRFNLCAANATPGGDWKRSKLPLTAFRGDTVTLEFFSSLNGSLNSNFLIDNVELCIENAIPGVTAVICGQDTATCPPPTRQDAFLSADTMEDHTSDVTVSTPLEDTSPIEPADKQLDDE